MKFIWNGLIFCGLYALVFTLNQENAATTFDEEVHFTSAISADIANRISDEYVKYLKTGIESQELLRLGAHLAGSHSQKDIFTESLADVSAADQFLVCTLCRATVNVFVRTFRPPNGELSGPNRDALAKKIMLDFCKRFNIQTQEVCSGLFDLNWPIIDYIFTNTQSDSRSFCGTLPIRICKAEQPEYNFTINIDANGPALTGSKSDLPERSENDLQILHLTDIHYDPEYQPGSKAICDEPMCCRDKPDANDTDASKLAGYWSDYRVCDTPLHTIENALDHIKKTHKVDLIYHTGDVIPHNVWSTTKEGNKKMLTEIHDLLVKRFPDTAVYSCLGNHEPHPGNIFGNGQLPEELSVSWLYEHIWSLWKKWLPADTKETILKGGYYTVVPSAGHRIIALNSMDCYLYNWWLFYNGSIAQEQLNWLHATLLTAEKRGEYVHILTHIPSGDPDCWRNWAEEYNRILARFSHIITGIFNGHTHKDEMNVHYTNEGHAIAVSWNGGSLTTYTYKNPNYRIYEVDQKTRQVLEHHTFIFNLTAANEKGAAAEPVWFKEYEFTKEFTNNTSPAGIDKLLLEMAEKPELLRKFWRYKATNADPKLEIGCDAVCLKKTICRLATSVYRNKKRCNELKNILQESLDNEITTTSKPTTPEPEDDGAASISAYKWSTLIGLLLLFKYFL